MKLYVSGMSCGACERHVERALGSLPFVKSVRADHVSGAVRIEGATGDAELAAIGRALERAGYPRTEPPSAGKRVGFFALSLALAAGISYLIWRGGYLSALPMPGRGMTLWALFLLGLGTSVHCLAMCGGISLPASAPRTESLGPKRLWPAIQYNLGRVIGYTVTGALVGLIGRALSPSPAFKVAVMVLAALFMLLMGLNMLGLLSGLRRLIPRLPESIGAKAAGRGPLVIGLLNALMPCGPLQAMQLYALGTGSALLGAVSMLVFSLGTVPLVLGFGALGALLSRKFHSALARVSALVVVALGTMMLMNALTLAGVALPAAAPTVAAQAAQTVERQTAQPEVQRISSVFGPSSYESITVKAGVPVEWTIHIDEKHLNGCNEVLYIPKLDMEVDLQPGDNLVEFTPTEPGTMSYSCWMGMIRSKITVEE